MGGISGSREPSPCSTGLGPSGFDPGRDILPTPGHWVGAILSQHAELGRDIFEEFKKHFNPNGWASVTDGEEQFIAWVATTPETIMEDAANVAAIQAAPALLAACRAYFCAEEHEKPYAEELMRAAIARADPFTVLPEAIAMEARRGETTGSTAEGGDSAARRDRQEGTAQ